MISTSEYSNGLSLLRTFLRLTNVQAYQSIPFCLSIKLFCVVDSEQTSTLDPLENTSVETKEKDGKSGPSHWA